MANNLRVFNLISDYNEAELVKPSVSFVVENGKVYYDDVPSPTFQGKWLATYSDSHTESADCDASSAITNGEIDDIDLVSVEIGDCVTTIGSFAFKNCSSLTSIDIPNSVTSIGVDVFRGCSSLTSIDIPDSVTSIEQYAFAYCSGLTSIDIPDSVTSIGNSAFDNCTSLTSCTIGSGATTIFGTAFYDCNNLQYVVCLPLTPPTISYNRFYNIPNGLIFYVPSESVETYKTASGWSDYASRIFPLS